MLLNTTVQSYRQITDPDWDVDQDWDSAEHNRAGTFFTPMQEEQGVSRTERGDDIIHILFCDFVYIMIVL